MSASFDAELKQVVAEVFEIPESAISDDVNFYESFDTDSLRIIEVVVELEKKFSVRIPPVDLNLEEVQTFGQLFDLIRKHVPEAVPA